MEDAATGFVSSVTAKGLVKTDASGIDIEYGSGRMANSMTHFRKSLVQNKNDLGVP